MDGRTELNSAGSAVVAACEEAWGAIQRQHPQLPDAVMVLGSGVERGHPAKLGRWRGAQWEAGGEHRGEVLLAGEALHLPVADVFEVLLHEAAHGINSARGVKDTSRGGRYHNSRFKATAEEVGLHVEQLPPYGWAQTSLGSVAAERYEAEIRHLADAMQIARWIDVRSVEQVGGTTGTGGSTGSGGRGSIALTCACGRRIRMAHSVADLGPVICGACSVEFLPVEAQRTEAPRASNRNHPTGRNIILELPDRSESLALQAERWAWRHRESIGDPIAGRDEAEVRRLNALVRLFRRSLGELSDAEIRAGRLVLAVGDQVVVTSDPPLSTGLPAAGTHGRVTAVSLEFERVTVDFGPAGHRRIGAAAAANWLAYGYAILDPAAERQLELDIWMEPSAERTEVSGAEGGQ